MKKIKVLMVANYLVINGISTVIYNYCMNINLDEFDITVAAGKPVEDYYKTELEKRGVKVISLSERKKEPRLFYKELHQLMKNTHFDIIHVHGNSATVTPDLFLAWRSGIKVRIMHSHNTTCDHMKLHKLLMPIFQCLYTEGFACGKEAGEWIFGKNKFTVIPNGISTKKFVFDKNKRAAVREQMGLTDKFVIGHVGRFNEQKNHMFLLKIFENIASKKENAVLFLVGSGPDLEKVSNYISVSPYKSRIIVYGESTDLTALYSAMDVFVLPSKYEGLGIVLLEAQINGLHCVTSDVVPKETQITGNIDYVSLCDSTDEWAEKILLQQNCDNREDTYQRNIKKIKQYDIQETVVLVEKKYKEILNSY